MKRIDGLGVLGQLIEAGVGDYIKPGSVKVRDYSISGVCDPAVLNYLRTHPQFLEGAWDLLHKVGPNQTEFRGIRGAFGKGTSVQFVISQDTFAFEADVDKFNTQDVVNIIGHLLGEVVPNTVRGWFSRKQDA